MRQRGGDRSGAAPFARVGVIRKAGLIGAVGVIGLSACSSGIEVVPAVDATAAACTTLTWPERVGSLERVSTDSASPAVAAWGDPAIIARCGIEPPGPTTDACVSVDGVDWVVRELSDGSMATTYGRAPAIEVLVPAAHGPAPLQLPAFSATAKSLPGNGRECQ